MNNYFYRGKLPHLQPPGGTFFVTMRLYGSIPVPVINRLKQAYRDALVSIDQQSVELADAAAFLPEDLQKAIERIRRKKQLDAEHQYFSTVEDLLESNLNEPHWLRQRNMAQLNADNFHHYAARYYQLWAFTIMSNHAHLLLTLKPDAPMLWKVLQDMKKFSGAQGNRLLNRRGHFWEEESYDHLVRNRESFYRILKYILNNPVKVGAASRWEDFEWNYCHPRLVGCC